MVIYFSCIILKNKILYILIFCEIQQKKKKKGTFLKKSMREHLYLTFLIATLRYCSRLNFGTTKFQLEMCFLGDN